MLCLSSNSTNSNSNCCNTIPNGTKASAAGLTGQRAIAQKRKNVRRGVVGGGVGHHEKRQQKMPVNNGRSGAFSANGPLVGPAEPSVIDLPSFSSDVTVASREDISSEIIDTSQPPDGTSLVKVFCVISPKSRGQCWVNA